MYAQLSPFEKKWMINFKQFFESTYFLGQNKQLKKKNYRKAEIIGNTQWTQSNACRLKTGGGVGFEVTGNVTFQGSDLYKKYYRKIHNNYTSRTNRRHKVWILLGYPCNILGYQSKYCNYTSKKKFGQFPYHSLPLKNSLHTQTFKLMSRA